MNLLLISNSTNAGEAYLAWPHNYLKDFFAEYNVKKVAFVPYAGISMGYDAYAKKVSAVLAQMNVGLVSVHSFAQASDALEETDAILVGGGNTFHLVYELHRTGLMQAIRHKVAEGMPYAGWSAGSNIACPGLYTTNDMPIVEPASFKTLNLLPFQINPHYLDTHPENHGGETREDRINEFLVANPAASVAGLREGTLLKVKGSKMDLLGTRPMRIFKSGEVPKEVQVGEDLSFLL